MTWWRRRGLPWKQLPRTRLSPLLLQQWKLRGPLYQVAPPLLPSGDSVAPRSPDKLWDPVFIHSFSMFILFHLASSLCSVYPSSRVPATVADLVQGGDVGHDPQVLAGEVGHNIGAPIPDRATATSAMAPVALEEVVGDGSLTSALGMTAAVGATTAVPIGSSVGESSPRPQMGAPSTAAIASDDIVEELEYVQGHPLLRAPGDVSLDEAMGMAIGCSTRRRGCSDQSAETLMMTVSASYYGPRCSRGGQPLRRQGCRPGSSYST
jgi:hypothetical protein